MSNALRGLRLLALSVLALAALPLAAVLVLLAAASFPPDLVLIIPMLVAPMVVGGLWRSRRRQQGPVGGQGAGQPRSPWRRLLYIELGMLVAAVVLWTTLTGSGRTSTKALLFLPSVIPDAPSYPIALVTHAPERLPVTFSDGRSTWSGDLYLPSTRPPHPGIIVTLGVTPAGRDDPRVVHLGEGLARMGVAALTPYSDNLINKTVTTEEIDFLVASFQYLRSRPEVNPGHVGFIGVCVGSSLALLAAEDDRINDQVDFVNFFGGYYDAGQFLEEVATHSYVADGMRVPWIPDRLTEEVMKLAVIRFLSDPSERRFLASVLIDQGPAEASEVAALSAQARAVFDLFTARDVEQVRSRIEELRPYMGELTAGLSPSRRLANLRARVYLMVDRTDPLIPYVETDGLARALRGRYERYSEFSIFSHVDLNKLSNPIRSVPQLWRLYRHIDAIFQSVL